MSGFEAGDTLIAIGSAVKFASVLAKWIVKHTLDQATPLGFRVALCGAISIESTDVAVTGGTADGYKQRQRTNTDANSDADLCCE